MSKFPYPAIVLALFVLASQICTSQQPSNGATVVPELIPPSPTAFQMTRYGDVPINESTGNISPSIPLYTYTAGRLQLPISLSFQGNGVKVDQAASWTGINWNLNAGGVITRVVRDEDDLFFAGVRESYSYEELFGYDTASEESREELNAFITSDGYDTEADIFSFSIPGYSGSFYLDKNKQPQLTKHDSPLKVILELNTETDNNYTYHFFSIITPDGVRYCFGGSAASEFSRNERRSAGSGGGQEPYAQTSFFLYRITHPLGDEIYLDYSSYGYHINIAEAKSYTKVYSMDEDCSGNPSSMEGPSDDGIALKSFNGKSLIGIRSNRNHHKVTFNSVSAHANVSEHYAKILKSIVVERSYDGVAYHNFKKFQLHYYYPHGANLYDDDNAERFFLKSVVFSDGSNVEYEYNMEYNDLLALPNRFSYAQDYLGYFNGITTNTSYLPKVDHPAFATVLPYLSDKSFNFTNASKGILKKLIYPTGGHTEFEYESSLSDVDYVIENRTKSGSVYIEYINQPPGGQVNHNPRVFVVPQLTLVEEGMPPIEEETLVNQSIKVRVRDIISVDILDHHTRFKLKVEDITNYPSAPIVFQDQVDFQYISPTGPVPHPYLTSVYEYPDLVFGEFAAEAGKRYRISVTIETSMYELGTVYGMVDFGYKVRTDEFEELGDIRIKKVSDYPSEPSEGLPSTKFYYYSEEASVLPRYLSYSLVRNCCSPGVGQNDYRLVTLSSSSISNLFANGSNAKMYREVSISYGGDAYELGGVNKKFINEPDGLPFPFVYDVEDIPFSSTERRNNKSVVNGTLLKETIIARKGSQLVPVQETENFYSINRSIRYDNNICRKLFNSCIVNQNQSLNHLAIEYYETFSNKIQLDSTVTRYFDQSDPEVLTTTTTYQYNHQYVGLPTNITYSSSSDGISYETINEYTTDPIGGRQLTEPIKTTDYLKKEGEPPALLGHTAIAHINTFDFTNKVLKKKVSTSKHSTTVLEERLTYHQYDPLGYPLEASKTDGTHIVYIWGYHNSQPIAKIENATYSQVQSYVANLQSLSDADDDRTFGYAGNEGALRTALDKLRILLPKAMVTTLTYDPLVGVTSVTDPRGRTVYYDYDTFGRLKHAKDAEGHLLDKNEYHYRND